MYLIVTYVNSICFEIIEVAVKSVFYKKSNFYNNKLFN